MSNIYTVEAIIDYINKSVDKTMPNNQIKRIGDKKDNMIFVNPVAIGGVGGSGTRVIAEILKQMNYYIGNDLNDANDNLSFVILLNRSKWFLENNEENNKEIMKRFEIFERIMTGSFEPDHTEIVYIIEAARDCVFFNNLSGLWGINRIVNILKSNQIDNSQHLGWGWKDPATYLFIKHMKEYFKSYKYIHVIRHGLDMAYSKNILHLIWFGKLFGIVMPKDSAQLPKALLNFWIKANNQAINNAKQTLVKNFLLINFDELCSNPKGQINKMLNFLEIDRDQVNINKLYLLPQKVKSIGRYKKHNLSIFDKKEIEEVKKLGFTVEG
ncbi:hypothetical protein D7D81_09590 [Halocella sp. SP3-1]|nr:hypothetical protein D7D81_09590 [Halocella sp. SP3-1]